MDDVAIGRLLRSIRVRLGRRQSDVAREARVSQQLVSLLENGGLGRVSLGAARSIATALGAQLVVTVRWRGAELDRLRDEDHARLLGAVAALLERAGWIVVPEVTFSSFGERGSIDLLAFHPATRMLVVIEIKTELASVEETLRRIDVKVRLAPSIARERFGWDVAACSSALVIESGVRAAEAVRRHDPVLRRVFAVRGAAAMQWLRAPAGRVGLLVFIDSTSPVGRTRSPARTQRVRLCRRRTSGGSRGIASTGSTSGTGRTRIRGS